MKITSQGTKGIRNNNDHFKNYRQRVMHAGPGDTQQSF
jgi:hypothetical protein